jgi:hypothetical protein
MDVQITHDFKGGDPFRETKKLFDKIGTYLVGEIRKRTQSDGIDADEKAFKPYSPGYKKGQSNRNVNLTKTGKMMQSLHRQDLVGVSAGEIAKAGWNEDDGRMFLGVNQKDQKVIEAIVDQYIDEEIKKI